jgi:hypothetical protein
MTSRIVKAIRGNLVAWLALFVALGGTSMAASHYLITSTKQIKPSVLSKLHGARGATGPAGPQGTPGAKGETGPQGPTGGTGPKGETGERGKEGKTGPEGSHPGPEGKEGKEGKEGPKGAEGKEGPKGIEGKEGPKGAEGPKGEKGEKGETGSGTLAWAHIKENGKIIKSNNLTTVSEPKTGIYCLKGITGEPHAVVATIDLEESAELTTINASVGEDEGECPAGTQISVETYELTTNPTTKKVEGVLTENGFSVEVE